ncbi:30S ribosomal protein S1 [Candidatus Caldipriscus sp.]|nr:30S ribosomal protein S1 [Candidatus Caldipriscus sp.]
MEFEIFKEVESLPSDIIKRGIEGVDLPKEGEIVEGVVMDIRGDEVFIDIGGKAEGILHISEFKGQIPKIGDRVLVYVEKADGVRGVKLSKYKADFERAWDQIYEAFQSGAMVEGKISKRVSGGYMVDVFGVEAFMPKSLSGDVSRVKTLHSGKTIRVKIIKANKEKRVIIVSRKDALEEEEIIAKQKLSELKPGMVVKGTITHIIESGVFVDIGGVEGFVHISELAWHKPKKIEDFVKIGEEVSAKVLDVDPENKRLSLSIKQLLPHPWETVAEKYPVGSRVKGKVTKLVDFGAFVEVEPGVEGLVYISEIRWGKPPAHPSEVLKVGQEIEAIVLNVDVERQRMSLGIKQTQPDPWTTVRERYKIGDRVIGKVYDFDQYGAFVELEDGIVGYLHVSNISWTKKFKHPSEALKKGKKYELYVLGINDKEHFVELSLKHLYPNPWEKLQKEVSENTHLKVVVRGASSKGLIVELADYQVEGFVPISQLVRKSPFEYKVGEEIDVAVISIEADKKRIVLSEKAYQRIKEEMEKKAMKEEERKVAETKPTLSLGDILKQEMERLKKLKE